MKLCKNVLISIITFVLLSCNSTTSSTESSISTPDIGIGIQEEKCLEVTAPIGWNSFKTNDSISLEIRNISEKQIASGPDFGTRIFVRIDDKWIEVKNKTVYANDPFILDPSENYDPSKTAAIFVRPDLPDYSVAYDVRIFVVGNLIEDGKEIKKVGSYIDLTLNP